MSALMLPSERARGHQRLPERLEVLEQHRVVEVVRVDADLAHDLVAELALGADGEVGGVGVAERRQRVLRRAPARRRAAGTGEDERAQRSRRSGARAAIDGRGGGAASRWL